MTARHFARLAGAAIALAFTFSLVPTSVATSSAAPCPDVEVVFARGTFAPQGFGGIGDDFVNAVRAKVGNKSVGAYAVVYPASTNFPTAVDGIRDAANHIESMAVTCPDTKMILGGYSQGAAVMGFVTANAVPGGVDPAEVPKPMPASVADHVAAVALLGTPDTKFMDMIGQPPVTVGPSMRASRFNCARPATRSVPMATTARPTPATPGSG